jgi:very-short-patch-repair endonuclease
MISENKKAKIRRKKNKQERKDKAAPYFEKQTRLEPFKKQLKINKTHSEATLYAKMKEIGMKFKFQKSFYSLDFACIVDFYFTCGFKSFVVEVDGGYHLTDEQKRKDSYRDKWLLLKRNCIVIRLTNDEVLSDVVGSIKKIAKIVDAHNSLSIQNGSINRKILSLILNSK